MRLARLTVLALSVLLAPMVTEAQQARRIPRIGLLGDAPSFLDEAFCQGLRELGYVDGQNIIVESRASDWKEHRLPMLADELVRMKVDVIVAKNVRATEAARKATQDIPIVFTVAGDPVADGLVASLARPGGNITGLATSGPELVAKQLEILKAVAPKVVRVAVLKNPTTPGHARTVGYAAAAARALGLELEIFDARTASEIETALVSISRHRVDGFLVLRDAVFRTERARIAAFAARQRLPAMYGLREEAEVGGLIAYGANVPELFRRAASYVDKILKGAKAADLPVEQPTKFELVINLKAAKALGLTIPPSVLARADEVIE
jgi:putative ABC transport system substrate-binding protein